MSYILIYIIYKYIHIFIYNAYNGILLHHEKGWIFAFYTDIDGTGGYYAEWNKSIRERQLSYGFTYMWNIRNSQREGKEESWMGKS